MKHGKHPFLRDLKENRVKWLMLLPAAIVVILMCYIPMGGIVLAFKEYNYHDGIFGSPWVAFKNFEYFFQSGKAWSVTRNTILYNLAFLCVNTFLQITCAILLSELAGKWFKRITQSVMFFPYFISWVVVGAFIYNMFNYEFGAVNTLLRSLGLYEHRNKFPRQVSGGQQQRCAIGRALVKNPGLLLCDEPTGALDYKTSKEILQLMEDVNRTYGCTIIIVTHNAAIAHMANRVLRLRDGHIVEQGDHETLLRRNGFYAQLYNSQFEA